MSEETMSSVYTFQSNIGDAEPPVPLPVGEYRGNVRSAEIALSKNTQKPQLVISYHVDPSQFPPDYTDGNPDGEVFTVYQSLADTPANRYRLRKFCEKHAVVPSNKINAPDFIGQDVILQITHDEYQGMMTARAAVARGV
jgi:hypothetical protein